MKTLLAIHSYFEAAQTVKDFWPWYKIPGWDIVGIDNEGPAHDWPENVPHVAMGVRGAWKKMPHSSNNQNNRFLDTFDFFLHHPLCQPYDNFCLVQEDGIFLRKPDPYPGGFHTHRAGGWQPGAKAKQFFHSPWWIDRNICEIFIREGCKLLRAGENELNSPDLLMGLIVDRTGLKWTEHGSVSINHDELQSRKQEVLPALKQRPCPWYFHGISTPAERDWVLEQVK